MGRVGPLAYRVGRAIREIPDATRIVTSKLRRGSTKSAGDNSFVIAVRAKPRASVSSLEADAAGVWIARLRSSPVDGKANEELIGLVAKHFGCHKSSVAVISGASARLKLVRISGATARHPGIT